jgi:hypothetical protein
MAPLEYPPTTMIAAELEDGPLKGMSVEAPVGPLRDPVLRNVALARNPLAAG